MSTSCSAFTMSSSRVTTLGMTVAAMKASKGSSSSSPAPWAACWCRILSSSSSRVNSRALPAMKASKGSSSSLSAPPLALVPCPCGATPAASSSSSSSKVHLAAPFASSPPFCCCCCCPAVPLGPSACPAGPLAAADGGAAEAPFAPDWPPAFSASAAARFARHSSTLSRRRSISASRSAASLSRRCCAASSALTPAGAGAAAEGGSDNTGAGEAVDLAASPDPAVRARFGERLRSRDLDALRWRRLLRPKSPALLLLPCLLLSRPRSRSRS
mmetsp:Transcript_15452/g.41840  ORF Transcript_15452/g.41840 Transcript_15452/m.41840 type:complete len:272 (+) Transcript_15452:3395-4210(+)